MQEIADAVGEHQIPPPLVVNMDETGLRIVPVDKYTLDFCGTKQIAVTGKEDKREITAVLAYTLCGSLLPPQLLYQGKTDRCYPGVKFPQGWDVHHSESHWSTQHALERCMETVLQPWLSRCKEVATSLVTEELTSDGCLQSSQNIWDLMEQNNI